MVLDRHRRSIAIVAVSKPVLTNVVILFNVAVAIVDLLLEGACGLFNLSLSSLRRLLPLSETTAFFSAMASCFWS